MTVGGWTYHSLPAQKIFALQFAEECNAKEFVGFLWETDPLPLKPIPSVMYGGRRCRGAS